MSNQILPWVAFNIFVVVMLALDLGFFHRQARVIRIKESLVWSAIWVVLALLFNLGIYLWRGSQTALEFLTGYLIERSLSIDNIFVFLLIFSYFRVSPLYQHKVLFWGILGAMFTRVIFIVAGVALIREFYWIIYIFGGFLILSGVKMALQKNQEINPERNPVLRLFRRFMPVTNHFEEGNFFVKRDGRSLATPLFIVLLVVESTDVIFAADSIPAILAITLYPFVVYSSNVFAILGLRALYFTLAGIMRLCVTLHYGLSAILVFVGIKMILAEIYKIPVGFALGIIATILAISVIVCLVRPRREEVSFWK